MARCEFSSVETPCPLATVADCVPQTAAMPPASSMGRHGRVGDGLRVIAGCFPAWLSDVRAAQTCVSSPYFRRFGPLVQL